MAYLAMIFTLLFNTGLSFVTSLSGKGVYFPGPWESADAIVNYFQHHQQDVLLCAFFQFAAAIPLGIFTATVVSRIQFLGSTAAGNHIALFGGFMTAFNLAFSAMMMWVMAYPEIASDGKVGEVSSFFMVFPALLFAIPLTRFPGFIWLIFVGFKLPKIKAEYGKERV